MITELPSLGTYDYIIVGSGPAGISAALRLHENLPDATIAIVESGVMEENETIQDLSALTGSADMGAAHFAWHTRRILGGTSSIWGGWCAALEERAFNAGEWPIEYSDIAPFYPAAAEIVNAPELAHTNIQTEIAETTDLIYKPFYLTRQLRIQDKYGSWLEENQKIEVIIGQTCTKIDEVDGTVTGIVTKESTGTAADEHTLKASHYIIACGGVINARILQLSGIIPNDSLGQNLMEHPHIYAATDIYLDVAKVRPYMVEDVSVAHALQLSPALCEQEGLLSFSVEFRINDTIEEKLLGRSRELTLCPVTIRSEMQPQQSNAITLSEQLDHLGQPRGHVNFQFNYLDLANRSWEVFCSSLLASGLGRPGTLPPQLDLRGGGHYIGTTRMGSSPENSVVDANCKVHGIDNLFIAGSSIFPASGAANPTFSIVAFALRLSDHLSNLAA